MSKTTGVPFWEKFSEQNEQAEKDEFRKSYIVPHSQQATNKTSWEGVRKGCMGWETRKIGRTKCSVTIAEAARTRGLTVAEVERWKPADRARGEPGTV